MAIEFNSSDTAPSPKHLPCNRCKHWVVPVRPHWGWRAAEVTFWASIPAALMAMKTVGPIGIPFLLIFAGGLAGPLRNEAGAEPTCPVCRCCLSPTPRLHAANS